MPIKAGVGLLGACLPRVFDAPTGSHVDVVVRSFSRLFRQPAKNPPKIVYSAPPALEGGHTNLQESSLQGGKAALQWAKFSMDEALHCPICHSGHAAAMSKALGGFGAAVSKLNTRLEEVAIKAEQAIKAANTY